MLQVHERSGLIALRGNVQDIQTLVVREREIGPLFAKQLKRFDAAAERSEVGACETLRGSVVKPILDFLFESVAAVVGILQVALAVFEEELDFLVRVVEGRFVQKRVALDVLVLDYVEVAVGVQENLDFVEMLVFTSVLHESLKEHGVFGDLALVEHQFIA